MTIVRLIHSPQRAGGTKCLPGGTNASVMIWSFGEIDIVNDPNARHHRIEHLVLLSNLSNDHSVITLLLLGTSVCQSLTILSFRKAGAAAGCWIRLLRKINRHIKSRADQVEKYQSLPFLLFIENYVSTQICRTIPSHSWPAISTIEKTSTMEGFVSLRNWSGMDIWLIDLAIHRLNDEWVMKYWPFKNEKKRARFPFYDLAGFYTWSVSILHIVWMFFDSLASCPRWWFWEISPDISARISHWPFRWCYWQWQNIWSYSRFQAGCYRKWGVCISTCCSSISEISKPLHPQDRMEICQDIVFRAVKLRCHPRTFDQLVKLTHDYYDACIHETYQNMDKFAVARRADSAIVSCLPCDSQLALKLTIGLVFCSW